MPMCWIQLAIICTPLTQLSEQTIFPHELRAHHQGEVLTVSDGLKCGGNQLSGLFKDEIVFYFC